MEAKAVMGELKYQRGDFSEARATFRDSLDASTKLSDPEDQVMGLGLYRSAELAARGGDFEAAREHLEILIRRFPGSEWARKGERLLGLLPGKTSQEGLAALEEPLISGEGPEALLGLLQALVREGSLEEALAACLDFLERYPGHASQPEVKLLGAALCLGLGKPAAAAGMLRDLASQALDSELKAKALHLLGASLLELGDHEGILREIPEAHPAKGLSRWTLMAQVWRAASEERLGLSEKAAESYRGFLGSGIPSPLRAYALAALAQDLDRQGSELAALKALRQTQEEAGRWGMGELEAASSLSTGHLLTRLRRFAQASSAYAGFLRRHPAHPQRSLALYQQGLALKRLGRREEALAAFLHLAQASPDSVYAPEAHLQLGQVYSELGEDSKAIAHYKLLGQDEQGRREALLLIAHVHYNQKRFAQAIPLYWEFLELYPGHPRRREVESLLLTSYWLGAREDPGLLKAAFLFQDHPITAHILWDLGARAYRQEDYSKAAEIFSRYASRYPRAKHASESLFYHGESLRKLGDFAGAALSYHAFLASFPREPRALGTLALSFSAVAPVRSLPLAVREAGLRLGEALFEIGKFEESASAFARAAKGKDRLAAEALLGQASSLSRTGQRQKALAVHQRFLSGFPSHPKSPWVRLQVAGALEAMGRLEEAAAAYARIPPGEGRIQALFRLGRIRERLKAPGVRQAYQGLVAERPAQDPTRLKGLLRLALLYELESKPLKAMPLYGEVLRLSPGESLEFETARKRLESMSRSGVLVKGR